MKKWKLATVACSVVWFAIALTVPALALRLSVPIDGLSAPLLSFHVLCGAACSVEYVAGCLAFTATQYGLDYWTLKSVEMAPIRFVRECLTLFWCMAVATTVLVLVLLFANVRLAIHRHRTRLHILNSAPAGIPIIDASAFAE